MTRKKDKKLSILDAVETLSAVAEVDVSAKETEAMAKEEESVLFETHLIEPKQAIRNPEKVKESFKAVHEYLKNMVDENRALLKSDETQSGIKAIIQIAEEAAEKIQKYSSVFKGVQGAVAIPEFDDLYDFYLSKIVRKVETVLAEEDKWKKTWEEEQVESDLERKSLKDLETVRKDKCYELFFIRDEEGKAYFNKNLLRHISLVGSFDEFFVALETEDPILKVQLIHDHLSHMRAKQILSDLRPHTDAFFKKAFKYKEDSYIAAMIKAYMALMLASNPQNLLSQASAKHATLYYNDFITFLREALDSVNYNQYIRSAPKDPFYQEALYLTHAFCSHIFITTLEKEEVKKLISTMLGEGKATEERVVETPMAIWHSLVNEDERLRHFLKQFPSGPLMKALDLLRDTEFPASFDPLDQGYFPSQLLTLRWNDLHVSVIRTPSPTYQSVISEAKVDLEFLGYLQSLHDPLGHQKALFFNLQDRSSWEEHARCKALEKLGSEEVAKKRLTLVTLSKSGSFYEQTEDFRVDVDASLFIDQFQEQLQGGATSGFYFPEALEKEVLLFSKKLFSTIHEVFFGKKKILTRKNRLDFIEIAYLFLELFIIEKEKPDVVLFSCKDGVDTSAETLTTLFTFLKLISQEAPLDFEIKRFIQWMLYSEALIQRERLIDVKRISRFISAISLVHAELSRDRKEVLSYLEKILPKKFLSSLVIDGS